MDEDTILKNRLQVDEKLIRRLAKKILDGDVADISTELQAFDLSMDKIARVISSVSSHFTEIQQLESHINTCIEKEFREVRDAHQNLIDAQVHLKNVTQYDGIAKEVFLLRSRDDLKNNIGEVEAQILSIMAQVDTVDANVESRLNDCRSVLSNLNYVYENVTANISEAKNK